MVDAREEELMMEQLLAEVGTRENFGDGVELPTEAMTLSTMSGGQKAMTASNPFIAELGLLTKLLEPRVSGKKEAASLPAPKHFVNREWIPRVQLCVTLSTHPDPVIPFLNLTHV